MKRITLSLCTLLLCATISFAQSNDPHKTDTASQAPYENKDSRFYQNEMIRLKQDEIPEAVKQTLKNDVFKGWESGTMFKSPDGEIYLLEMGEGDRAKVYRFDSHGKAVRGN